MFEVTLKPLLLVLAAFALVLGNGVFVAAQFAIVRVRRTRLEELVGQGVEKAKDAILVALAGGIVLSARSDPGADCGTLAVVRLAIVRL